MQLEHPAAPTLLDDSRYLAMKARDARFDGRFFTGVTSTGIYCRPVCKVRAPKRENCRFFPLAAQAEQAGFRPCLRCRPELAPGCDRLALSAGSTSGAWSVQESSAILAQQAARMLDAPHAWSEGQVSMATLAARLGVSERHVRRIFEAHWGVSPLQYWQTRRLLTAKQLLTDTTLSVSNVALQSGFASVRRFNAAFVAHYRLQPLALRKAVGAKPTHGSAHVQALKEGLLLRAAYRPPYDVTAMLQFYATRQIAGLEVVDVSCRTLARTLQITQGRQLVSGWVEATFALNEPVVHFVISPSLGPALPAVLVALRALLDLDADPQAINTVLLPDFPDSEGLRLPGAVDGFELAVRAVLGQQITVAAARTLATRLVARYGAALKCPISALQWHFPTPEVLAHASADDLGQLGIVKQRQRAIQALAMAVCQGQLALHPAADVPATMTALQALPGFGHWTANYIAMRALRWPDAFPAGDVALHKALGVQDAHHPALAAEAASQRWRPWRSYAVLRAWARLAAG